MKSRFCDQPYLPVLSLTLEQEWIFRFADFARVVILNLLDVDLRLNAVVLGECAFVSLLQVKYVSTCCLSSIYRGSLTLRACAKK